MSSYGVGREVTWFGHRLSCRRRNTGPFIHLSFSAFTWILRDRSSATLSSLRICIHRLWSELLWISPTVEDTNGLKLRDRLWIQAKMIVPSVMIFTSPNYTLDSFWMTFARWPARTAACSSKHGMVSCFKCATRDFAAMNFTPFVVHYEKICNHLCETATNSANIHSLARKYEHLRINQIQLRFLHFNQHSITLLGIHVSLGIHVVNIFYIIYVNLLMSA